MTLTAEYRKGLQALNIEGFVVLDNAVDKKHLDTLYTEIVEDGFNAELEYYEASWKNYR